MELQFYGANCLRLSAKKAQIVVDDNLAQLGLKSITKPTDISLRTSKMFSEHPDAVFRAELPGEYEIGGVVIHGIAARGHMDEEGQKTAVIYTIEADDTKVAILGHIYPELSEEQLEAIGMVDVAVVPIGGHGYTLDGVGALKVIKQIEPAPRQAVALVGDAIASVVVFAEIEFLLVAMMQWLKLVFTTTPPWVTHLA